MITKRDEDLLMERNDEILDACYDILNAVHVGKPLDDEDTRSCIVAGITKMALEKNNPSEEDIKQVYEKAHKILQDENIPDDDDELEWDICYIGELADFLETYLLQHPVQIWNPCYPFFGSGCICCASEDRCKYCTKPSAVPKLESNI